MKTCTLLLSALCISACSDVTPTTPSTQLSRLDAGSYELVDLGTLGTSVQAFGIDDNGAVFGRYVTNGVSASFRWTDKTGFEDLGGIDGKNFQYLRNNKHDALAGWIPADAPTVPRAVVYLPHSGYQYIDDASHGGQAWAINKYGTVAGQRFPLPQGPSEAFLWSESTGFESLPLTYPAGTPRGSTANEITDDSVVTGSLAVFNPAPVGMRQFAYVWDPQNGTQVLPKVVPTANVAATDVNSNHVAIGASETRAPIPGDVRTGPLTPQASTIPVHAWRWSATRGLEDLGTLGGRHSVAWAIDDAGNAYGWAQNADGVMRAVKWPWTGAIVELPSLGGASQTGAVNKHGVLAAQAITSAGEAHAVIYLPSKK